jgi:hypothetical protein
MLVALHHVLWIKTGFVAACQGVCRLMLCHFLWNLIKTELVLVALHHVLWIKTGFIAACQVVRRLMLLCSILWIKTGMVVVVPLPLDCKEL